MFAGDLEMTSKYSHDQTLLIWNITSFIHNTMNKIQKI